MRLPGLEDRSPRRALLTRGEAVDGWEILRNPQDVYRLHDVNDLLVEGGSATATAFLAEDLVDRILIYRAPIIVGEGKSSFGYVGLDAIADAHGRWRLVDERRLGVDRLEVYERVRDAKRRPCSPGSSPTSAPSAAPSSAATCGCVIATGYDIDTVDLGASIACSGVCLTVVDKGEDWFAVDVSGETVSRTAAGPCGAKARGSTSNARCGWATSSAAISSPAMSTRSARSSAVCAEGDSTRDRHQRRRARSAR